MEKIYMGNDFASGADISWLPQMEASGFVFKDRTGSERDCLEILKDYGLNAVRLRAWVNPSDSPHSGHCSTAETLALASRAQKLGFRVMVNFHYSDSWADPGKQVKPAAWQDLQFDALVDALSNYTKDVMQTFIRGGVTPEWVQLGNETNPGMLLPDGSADDFSRLTRLYNAGHDAVKSVSPETRTMVHLAEGNNIPFVTSYFDSLAEHGCRYDMIGLSYYPYWLKSPYEETIDDIGAALKLLPERYNKPVMLVEIGGVDEEEDRSYDMLAAALRKISEAPKCRGFFYWEPTGARVWSKYALSAWNGDGTPTKAMDAYLTIACD
jgi:arabinogalactan endo-1,4-beta-galactosidase